MSDEDLTALLDELRSTIADADGLTDEDRARLDELTDKIEDESVEDESVLEHAEETLNRFEVEHAGLVRVINRIADALSAGGL